MSELLNTCPVCSALIDVSEVEPYSRIVCGGCGDTIRVRTGFHHFTITAQVGTGGMSRVFRAHDQLLDRDVALKILNRECSRDGRRLRSFEREAQLTAQISHPNVVKVYSSGHDQGYFYIAMELVDGGSLDERMRAEGKMDEARVLEIAIGAAQGLRAASAAGLIHRDVKPGNILFSADGTAKIVDFGLAVIAREGTEDAEIWATPFYVAPETVFSEPEDSRSDLYSLGASLYHALTGRPVVEDDTNSLAELKIVKARPVDFRAAAAAGVSAETIALLKRCLERRPADRHAGYDEFIDHVRHALRRLHKGGSGGTPWSRRMDFRRAHWITLGAAAAGLAALVWVGNRGRGVDPRAALPLTADSDPAAVGAGAGSDTSAKFLAARGALFAGRTAEAEALFTKLAAADTTRQPTRNWAWFNAGVAALVEGNAADARKAFAALRAAGAGSTDAAEAETAEFFVKCGTWMESAEPVPPDRAVTDSPPDSARALGLLAAGLKNWHSGDLAGGIRLLRAFDAARPPSGAAWISGYKPLIAPHLADAKTLDELPPAETEKLTPEQTAAAAERAKDVLARVKAEGPAKLWAQTRFSALSAAAQAKAAAAHTAAAGELATKSNTDLLAVASANSAAAALGETYAFQAAVDKLRALKMTSPLGTEVCEEHVRQWENAATFLTQLALDLQKQPVADAAVERRSGGELRGRVTAAAEALKVQSAKGPEVTLLLTETAAPSLVRLAERVLERTADSDEFHRRNELLVAFALRAGMPVYGAYAGTELAREYRPFRERWNRLLEAR